MSVHNEIRPQGARKNFWRVDSQATPLLSLGNPANPQLTDKRTSLQCSPASVGLAQAHLNNYFSIFYAEKCTGYTNTLC